MFVKIFITFIDVALTAFLCWFGTFIAGVMHYLWLGLLWDLGILIMTYFDLRKVWRGAYNR